MRRLLFLPLALITCLSAASLALAGPPKDEEDEDVAKARVYHFEADVAAGELLAPGGATMGATPGGAQDIGSFRDRVADGQIPLPQTFTPEGLFSEHDLPLTGPVPCKQTFCAEAEAMEVALVGQEEVEFLAQLGFSSGLDPKTFERAPLNLIVVVDRSGSMSGDPLDLVQASLRAVHEQLGPDDQIAIVGYDSTAHVMLSPVPVTRAKRKSIRRSIAQLDPGGATAMEEGLRLAFELAGDSAPSFKGTTRVMLFTDERPNVGRTDAGSFMSMARAASRKGVGLTTIGVSTHFGAELAQEVSSVRGGNLFFFPRVQDMRETFAEEFDTMVTELAYDLNLELSPAPGMKITGVYGIPGSAIAWRDDTIVLDIETIFLSRRKGAIYVGLSRDAQAHLPPSKIAPGDVLGQAALAYEDASSGRTLQDQAAFAVVDRQAAGLGLTRGELLVDQATSLRRASALHHQQNDQEGAYRMVQAIAQRMRQAGVSGLEGELELLGQLEQTLAEASGHQGEDQLSVAIDPISGLPPQP